MIGPAFHAVHDQVEVPLLRRHLKLVVPDHRDPRIRLAAVILTLQILGQTLFGFKLSVAQILVSIGVCAAIEIVEHPGVKEALMGAAAEWLRSRK